MLLLYCAMFEGKETKIGDLILIYYFFYISVETDCYLASVMECLTMCVNKAKEREKKKRLCRPNICIRFPNIYTVQAHF